MVKFKKECVVSSLRQWDGVCLCHPPLAEAGSLLGATSESWGTLYHPGSCCWGTLPEYPSPCLYGDPPWEQPSLLTLSCAVPTPRAVVWNCCGTVQACPWVLVICYIELYKTTAEKVPCFVLVCESCSAIPPPSSAPGGVGVGRCDFPGCLWEIRRAVNIKVPGTRGQCFFSRKLPCCL